MVVVAGQEEALSKVILLCVAVVAVCCSGRSSSTRMRLCAGSADLRKMQQTHEGLLTWGY